MIKYYLFSQAVSHYGFINELLIIKNKININLFYLIFILIFILIFKVRLIKKKKNSKKTNNIFKRT